MPDTIHLSGDAATVEIMMAGALSLALQNAVARQQLDASLASSATAMAAAHILTASPDRRGSIRDEFTQVTIPPEPVSSRHSGSGKASPERVDAVSRDADAAGSATAMALQFVAQSVALSVQDAANHVRNLSTVCLAAIGASLAQMEGSGGDGKAGLEEIRLAQDTLARGTAELQQITRDALGMLEQLGRGERVTVRTSASDISMATAQALSNAAHNATTNQHQANLTSQAALTMGVSSLYSLSVPSGAPELTQAQAAG